MATLPILWSVVAAEDLAVTPPRCESSAFRHPTTPGAEVLSISAEEYHNVSTRPYVTGIHPVSDISYCSVKVYLTHPGGDDKVLVETWLPLTHEAWNGRFQATGGGGFSNGFFDQFLGPGIEAGYAVSSTDGGHQEGHLGAGWMLKGDRNVNWNLLQNFAHRSLADQVYVGKGIAEQYFGKAPHHSYWVGCSTGGRQGYAMAQEYPGLVDGIYAYAPALGLSNIVLADFWPQLVMNEAGLHLSNCELGWFLAQAMEECDILDGVKDEILEDPEACHFNPETLVGQKMQCGGEEIEITKAMTDIARKVWEGPRTPFGESLWHGLPHGTPTQWIANITIDAAGIRSQNPFKISNTWIQTLLLKNPTFNTSTLTYSDWAALWTQSNEQYGWLINSDNANLEAFRDAGGKLLTWHGMNDPVIPYQNTIKYHQRVEMMMGGSKAVNDFYKVFLAPGVEHCGRGVGPIPKDPLEVLVDWVENGQPPDRLEAETTDKWGERLTRDLCAYPKRSRYMGIGDGKRASSWACEGGEEEEEEEEQLEESRDFVGGLKDRLMQIGMDMGFRVS